MATPTRLRPSRLAASSSSSAAFSRASGEADASAVSATPAEKLRPSSVSCLELEALRAPAPQQRLHLAARAVGAGARHQQAELLAAVAAGHVAAAAVVGEQRAEGGEQPVADGMAMQVVDALEVVEVDDHQRHRLRLAPGEREQRRQRVVEVAAVEQAGQRVARGLLAQRGLQRLHLVDLVRELRR